MWKTTKKIIIETIFFLLLVLRIMLGSIHSCRYPVSCLLYSRECFLNEKSFWYALWLSAKRVAGCHPFFRHFSSILLIL